MLNTSLTQSSLPYFVKDHAGVAQPTYGNVFDAASGVGIQVLESTPTSGALRAIEVVYFDIDASGSSAPVHSIDETLAEDLFDLISDFQSHSYDSTSDNVFSSKVTRQFASRMRARTQGLGNSLANGSGTATSAHAKFYTGYGKRDLNAGTASSSIIDAPVGFVRMEFSAQDNVTATIMAQVLSAAVTASSVLSDHSISATDFVFGS